TREVVNEEKETVDVVNEEKETVDNEVSTEDVLSTAQQKVSTDKEKLVLTDQMLVLTDLKIVPTRIKIVPLGQIKKGVELKDVEETERPRPTSTRSLLTLKPLPKIDPKDKGKKKIEEEDESDTESKGISEAEKKFKQLARDEEMARKAALSNEYDFIQARIEADRLLALRLQDEEREKFTVEERAKFLHDTIAAQRRFLAEQRAIAIRNKPPTRTQLRNQMMTYLKHVGKQEDSKALVTIDREGVDWTSHSEEEEDYALMACNSSSSNTEREQLSDASIEIKAYTQGLKKVKA
ncbi:hypothetical protein Tco_1190167, partial [Tanacetum coccineum]